MDVIQKRPVFSGCFLKHRSRQRLRLWVDACAVGMSYSVFLDSWKGDGKMPLPFSGGEYKLYLPLEANQLSTGCRQVVDGWRHRRWQNFQKRAATWGRPYGIGCKTRRARQAAPLRMRRGIRSVTFCHELNEWSFLQRTVAKRATGSCPIKFESEVR